MYRISSLPDDLILKIVSFPRTEVAITTSLLSKGWRDVWKHVPKLEYYQRGLGGSANTGGHTVAWESTLRLRRVEFSNDEIVPRILSGCPVLEDLTVVREHNGSVKNITIMVPSLLRLTVLDFKFGSQVPGNDVGFVIKAPSLKSLTVVSQVSWVCSLVNMPNLVKANIKLPPPGDSKKLLECLTSAKHLSLCAIPSTFSYPIGVFHHHVSLKLCTCCSVWFCLILRSDIVEAIRLPGSLYTCQTLVTLRLLYTFIVDVPLTICFPSLKTLRLRRVEFSNDEIVPRILSGCPVLEDLTVVREHNGSVKNITIMVPSLLRLTVLDFKFGSQVPGNDVGFVIKAPSLKSLTVVSQVSWVCSLVNMPNLVKANIKLPPPGDSKKLLECLTSAKHLSLCAIPSTFSYPIGVFHHHVSLKLCTCCSVWFCLILRSDIVVT
ncbi:hypothetical protein DY000_02034756 [Brassica cretica]|uniref:F-box domain-containing protein n=1 Tax=Brassica cretica TaxID=69181 RepID=A0ABQ7DK31_BRACR|nr:hypothetical protein DY000_02034756 [Brassica cretica]